jgi:hypothetical protein
MRTITRRTFLGLLATSLVLVGILGPLQAAAPAERSAHVTILQLNDLYDIMPVEKGKKGGLARVATLRDRIAKENPNTVLILSGDFLSPSTMSSMFQGSQMVAGLNAIGLDCDPAITNRFRDEVARHRMRESTSRVPSTQEEAPVLRRAGLPGEFNESGWHSSASPRLRCTCFKGRQKPGFLTVPAANHRARRGQSGCHRRPHAQDMATTSAAAAVPEIDLI